VQVPAKFSLEDGRSYLVQDSKKGTEAFCELAANGHESLLITDASMEDIEKEYKPRPANLRRLSDSGGIENVAPGDLLGISLAVKEFLQGSTRPVVLIHGVEYLVSYNGFSPVLRLIQGLDEANATRRGILLLCVASNSLERKQEALLTSETTPLPTKR
jgi:hypothetical protein